MTKQGITNIADVLAKDVLIEKVFRERMAVLLEKEKPRNHVGTMLGKPWPIQREVQEDGYD